jgi:hypothetical protein
MLLNSIPDIKIPRELRFLNFKAEAIVLLHLADWRKCRLSVPGLGRVKTALRGRRFCKPGPGRSQAVIASISGLNLTRVINIVGIKPLIDAITA